MVRASHYPLIEEIEAKLTPLDAFALLKDKRFSFFLDSGMDPHKLGRYSFIGSDPFMVFSARGNEGTISQGSKKRSSSGNPFDVLG
ncbi:MAG: anthranilate synthase component I, partial [Dehalococcoidales bacterium]|nr:anthranilate synthase component I [Dehalococcoidales bacterium]